MLIAMSLNPVSMKTFAGVDSHISFIRNRRCELISPLIPRFNILGSLKSSDHSHPSVKESPINTTLPEGSCRISNKETLSFQYVPIEANSIKGFGSEMPIRVLIYDTPPRLMKMYPASEIKSKLRAREAMRYFFMGNDFTGVNIMN